MKNSAKKENSPKDGHCSVSTKKFPSLQTHSIARQSSRTVAWLFSFATLCLLSGCGPRETTTDQANVQEMSDSPVLDIKRIQESADIENLLQLTDRIYSGGEPTTAASMKRLSDLGIKTLICVDGVQPAVQLAADFGMRYVHVPIGYDGITADAGGALAKAVRELEGPIFVHCHHGKHRGPAAAAICVVTEAGISSQQATEVLETAGTSRDYGGLWRDVANFSPPADTASLPPLVEAAAVDSFISAMAAIGRAHDHLVLLKTSNWKQRSDHPDLVATQEAIILYEGFRESLRFLQQSNPYDEAIKREMLQNIRLLESFQQSLESQNSATADDLFESIQENCKSCHKSYRN